MGPTLELQWSRQPESALIPCKHTRKSLQSPNSHAEPGRTAWGPASSENCIYCAHTNTMEKTDTSLGSPRDSGGDKVPRQDKCLGGVVMVETRQQHRGPHVRGASSVTANSAEGWQHRTATCQAEGLSWMSCPQDTPDTCLVGTRQARAYEEELAKHMRGR